MLNTSVTGLSLRPRCSAAPHAGAERPYGGGVRAGGSRMIFSSKSGLKSAPITMMKGMPTMSKKIGT
jgi:hypothetical protein